MSSAKLDDTDRRLIALLRQDARMSVATLAGKLGVSRGTVAMRGWEGRACRVESSSLASSRSAGGGR